MALLATPVTHADGRMPNELPSNHEREMISSEYAMRGTSHATLSAIASGPEAEFADLRQTPSALVFPGAELSDNLLGAVREAAGRDAESMRKLRIAVARFTLALREMGASPEHVLIALKTVINNRSAVAIAPHTSDWSGDNLREKISTWCISEFFGPTAS